jgi:uncharacterized protein (DUF1697 family)
MHAFVALLRGVNVGAAKRVPMADWRDAMQAELGYAHVRTLLNSGNAVFDAPGAATPAAAQKHAEAIAKLLAMRLAVTVPVIVKTRRELDAIVAENPLAASAADLDPSRLLVAFAPDAAVLQSLAPIAALAGRHDRFVMGTHAAYLHCPAGLLESAAAEALLGKAGRAVTTRNWATTQKLHALAHSEE